MVYPKKVNFNASQVEFFMPDEVNHGEENEKDDSSGSEDSESDESGNSHEEIPSTSGNNASIQPTTGHYDCVRRLLEATPADMNGDLFDKVREDLELSQERCSRLTLPVADEPPLDPVRGHQLLEKALAESGKIRASLQGLVQASRLSRPPEFDSSRRKHLIYNHTT